MNKHYFITLQLLIGEFEKTTSTIVPAENAEEAKRMALEGECHEWCISNEDPDVCEDGMTGMTYEVFDCKPISQDDVAVLRKYM